jgi:hypothetical protein
MQLSPFSCKKAYDSVRREALYNILTEFGIPKKLVRLIKLCLSETYSRVRVGKNLSEMFPIRNGLKQGEDKNTILNKITVIVDAGGQRISEGMTINTFQVWFIEALEPVEEKWVDQEKNGMTDRHDDRMRLGGLYPAAAAIDDDDDDDDDCDANCILRSQNDT